MTAIKVFPNKHNPKSWLRDREACPSFLHPNSTARSRGLQLRHVQGTHCLLMLPTDDTYLNKRLPALDERRNPPYYPINPLRTRGRAWCPQSLLPRVCSRAAEVKWRSRTSTSGAINLLPDSNVERLIAPGREELGDSSRSSMVVNLSTSGWSQIFGEKYINCVTFLVETGSFLSLENFLFLLQIGASLSNFFPPCDC